MMRRVLTHPAAHFLLGGLALFCMMPLLAPSFQAAPERPSLVVPAAQVVKARQEFEAKLRRSLSDEELALAEQVAVERELLVRFALDLGLDRQPEIQRRLAQIAAFVADDLGLEQNAGPDAHSVDPEIPGERVAEMAEEAKRLGLHEGDRVVRSLLMDRSKRLIRAAVLAREPSEEALEAYWREHAEDYVQPASAALDVAFLGRGASADKVARALGEPSALEALEIESWPMLEERDIARRLGSEAAAALRDLDVGAWQGPLESRDGPCLVRLRERLDVRPAPLDAVRDEVRARVRQQLADRWLETRLDELRQHYEIEVERPAERVAEKKADENADGKADVKEQVAERRES